MLDVVVFVLGAWGDRLCNKYNVKREPCNRVDQLVNYLGCRLGGEMADTRKSEQTVRKCRGVLYAEGRAGVR